MKNFFTYSKQFLSFQSAEIRDEFLNNFEELIEDAFLYNVHQK
jgi:hypothetical protein